MQYVITKLEEEHVSVVGVFDEDHSDEADGAYAKLSMNEDDETIYDFHTVEEENVADGVVVDRCRVYLGYNDDRERIHILAIKEDHDVEMDVDDDEDLSAVMDFYSRPDEDVHELRHRALETVSDLLEDARNDDYVDSSELIEEIDGTIVPDRAIKIDYRDYSYLKY